MPQSGTNINEVSYSKLIERRPAVFIGYYVVYNIQLKYNHVFGWLRRGLVLVIGFINNL
jgi:hypothetical protein